jgi:hypothetical protein
MNKARPTAIKSNRNLLLGLVLFGGVVAGVAWFMQNSAPVPPPVVASLPKPKPVAPVVEEPPAPEPPPVADEQPAPPPPPPGFGGFDPNDPQVQAMMQQRMKQMNDNMYGDLWGQMNLSPDQQAKVDDLMMQRAQAVGAIFQNAFQQGGFDPNTDPAQFQQQIDLAQAAANQALQATLGDANYLQLQARDQQIRQSFQNGGFRGGGPGGPGGGG